MSAGVGNSAGVDDGLQVSDGANIWRGGTGGTAAGKVEAEGAGATMFGTGVGSRDGAEVTWQPAEGMSTMSRTMNFLIRPRSRVRSRAKSAGATRAAATFILSQPDESSVACYWWGEWT